MTFRVMTIEDYENVFQLWLSCKGMGLNNLDDSRDGISKFLKRNPDTCFVCTDGDTLVGVIIAGHDGRRGYIYHTAVHPEFRRQGIGKGLLGHAVGALQKEGINKAAMLVFARNHVGNTFWENEGFSSRNDIIYRDKTLTEIVRMDT